MSRIRLGLFALFFAVACHREPVRSPAAAGKDATDPPGLATESPAPAPASAADSAAPSTTSASSASAAPTDPGDAPASPASAADPAASSTTSASSASAAPTGPGPADTASPACGALPRGVSDARAGKLVQDYYKRALRRLVQDWARRTYQGQQAATATYVVAMARRRPRVESIETRSGAEFRATLGAMSSGSDAARKLVCVAPSVPDSGSVLVVALYLSGPPPVPPDSGVFLEVHVEPASGEVLAVWNLQLG